MKEIKKGYWLKRKSDMGGCELMWFKVTGPHPEYLNLMEGLGECTCGAIDSNINKKSLETLLWAGLEDIEIIVK